MINKKVILLLSGGFDSGVAGYMLEKKGFEIIPLHLSNIDFVGDETVKKCRKISEMFNWKKMYVMDIANALQEFVEKSKHSYFFILMKRLMLVLASIVAESEDVRFIATGESLGQVSSQTLANINVIESATRFRVIKPLLAMDKETIINISKEIGTFDVSVGPEVCDLLGPKRPVTNANSDVLVNEELKLDLNSLINDCVENQMIVQIS